MAYDETLDDVMAELLSEADEYTDAVILTAERILVTTRDEESDNHDDYVGMYL